MLDEDKILERVFLDAMANRCVEWLSGGNTPYEHGDVIVQNFPQRYTRTMSTDQIYIWDGRDYVWRMELGFWCLPEAFEFLISSLLQSYHNDPEFLGGRGPSLWRGGKMIYENRMRHRPFWRFAGVDKVLNTDRKPMAACWYSGGRTRNRRATVHLLPAPRRG